MNTVLRQLDRLADLLLSPAARKAVEHSLVRISIVLFLLHAVLFAAHEADLASAGRSLMKFFT